MALFIEAYNKTEKNEGGYCDVKGDRGGETYKGIARNFHKEWGGWLIIDEYKSKDKDNFIKELDHDESLQILVESFYKTKFWDVLKGDDIPCQPIAEKLFDVAVNQGVRTASTYMQNALNYLNNDEKHYKSIKVDGKIGKNTLNAFNLFMGTASFSSRNSKTNEEVFEKVIDGLQFKRYLDIITRDKSQKKFFYGWTKRI